MASIRSLFQKPSSWQRMLSMTVVILMAVNISAGDTSLTTRIAQRRKRQLQARDAFLALEPRAVLGPETSLGALHSIKCSGAQCDILCETSSTTKMTGPVPLRLVFITPTIVRYWLAIDGNFSDVGAAADVIIGKSAPVKVALVDRITYWEISATNAEPGFAVVQLAKSPLTLTVVVDGKIVMNEVKPLTWNGAQSWQSLARDKAPMAKGLTKEYFFGGGMQNGRFSHRDSNVTIAKDFNWADGGHPNSVPWYLSTAGYGVLRNTWRPGHYSFSDPVVTLHNETYRFDAFYVFSPDVKSLLGQYTYLTGPPFLPPIYGLFLGDSDCYHNSRHGNSTQVAVKIGELYRVHDMPGGWLLPNDGYGCGYGEGSTKFPSNLTDLAVVVAALHKVGFYTGLWTSTGMPNIKAEVGVAGTRVCKTDVGWIGSGYKYAFDGVEQCVGGIEQYSSPPARRFVWTVEGWAGTHRNAVMWNGDNSGSFKYIQWQLPTFVGTGLSAQAHVSGDVDGIFGGSPETYVRDLQFKSFMTTVMVMSGWAKNPDKQPWTYGEPYTSINRASLKLKARLTPYMYTYSRIAYDTGVPPVRALLMEFPTEEALYVHSNATAYQFMSGEHLLVAPVFDDRVIRDGIYLPGGTQWMDWWDGTLLDGGTTLNGYDAPLDKIPLFVRAGAIIPMWPEMNYFDEKPHDPMFLQLWPQNFSSFELYEDDGITRDALEKSSFATTLITMNAPNNYLSGRGKGNVTIMVGPSKGSFEGKLQMRSWWLNIRCKTSPLDVVLDGKILPPMSSESELEFSKAGWFYDRALQPQAGGLLMVKLGPQNTSEAYEVVLSNGPSYSHLGTETCDTTNHHQVEHQQFDYNNSSNKFVLRTSSELSPAQCVTIGRDKDSSSHTSAIELQTCSTANDAAQQFKFLQSGQIASVASGLKQCLDQDMSVHRVILYACHNPSKPGNQGWKWNASGNDHIQSTANNLCVAAFSPQN